ncbi:hypothetical protein BOV_1643 [Brucella ovis ATCC 25840]|uniref:Uncharacterized protein n=1 Tax=Brucella ovis (strain ATCC 25840 / 63/290 / NCTC 10512) TaxID=444178 RepID=A0A0H3AQ70_BRUO2|nr:hypothetical protein BOV_1643 [Brucella ovis ATCC 25840]
MRYEVSAARWQIRLQVKSCADLKRLVSGVE